MTTKWAMSVLDWRNHAVDERRDHPVGGWQAECGHRLAVVATLHDEPFGALCEQCAAKRLAPTERPAPRRWPTERARAATDETANTRRPRP